MYIESIYIVPYLAVAVKRDICWLTHREENAGWLVTPVEFMAARLNSKGLQSTSFLYSEHPP
jgi:hypothetical protein